MFKKILLVVFLLVIAAAGGAYFMFFSAATAFSEKSRFFYIPSEGANQSLVVQTLKDSSITNRISSFELMADQVDYWASIKPGRYQIEKGMSIFKMVRLLKSGKQTPVKLVINKLRTMEDVARRSAQLLEPDSLAFIQFLHSPDSLRQFGLDTNTAVTMIIPNTYSFFWNTSASKYFRRMHQESLTFWNEQRLKKAAALNLTKEQVYTLASIVEEETNKNDEKPVIASVYLNRLRKPMRLGADPTVKFALKNFGLKRILFKHINESAASPYNTYRNYGLPPGPICTPSVKTIDAVLDAAQTEYIFFCAKADFSGYHAFASNEKDHYANARAYQKALDSLRIK